MRETFGSVCHGAGRLMSRTAVRSGRDARQETKKLEEAGILVRSETRDGILEELPQAYKNVDEVIRVSSPRSAFSWRSARALASFSRISGLSAHHGLVRGLFSGG